ncbi:hypothetical protein BGY98DRAFT_981262 [Russula aff. rugulosa BPL654]|nr:hypothetical protein BGY98DRAFT_981262 [Russula aff. rugulosa BPL654]
MTSAKSAKVQSSGAGAESDDDALRPETEETTCIVIIGGGPAGIAAAITLKEDLGYEGFTIYEQAQEGVGGVWRDNTYPGCGCDIPAHWYSFSRALNPNWGACYASQREIRAYWEALWARYGLRAHTRLGTEVVRATWDADAQHYTVVLEDVTSKACRTVSAKVVLSATGGFQQPRIPEDLLGLETFLGDKWHSSNWRHDVSLAGKRVGVIGNGCSAAQFVPQISADSTVEVINFCRSPQWYTERTQYDHPRWAKWAFAHVPFVMRAYRAFLMVKIDLNYFFIGRPDSQLREVSS